MTANTVISQVREELNDRDKTRWSDPVLLQYLSDGERRVYEKRPDLFLQSNGTSISTPVQLTGLTDPMILDEMSKEGLVSYVCYRGLNEDSDDKLATGRANGYLRRFYGVFLGHEVPVRGA